MPLTECVAECGWNVLHCPIVALHQHSNMRISSHGGYVLRTGRKVKQKQPPQHAEPGRTDIGSRVPGTLFCRLPMELPKTPMHIRTHRQMAPNVLRNINGERI